MSNYGTPSPVGKEAVLLTFASMPIQRARDNWTTTSPTGQETIRPPTTVRVLVPSSITPLHTLSATSEGGYGAPDTFSPSNQRHADTTSSSASSDGLIDQSLDGGPLGRELQDAKQGADPRTREQFAHEARRDFAPSSGSY